MKQYIFFSFLFLCVIGITKAQVIIGDGREGAPAILQIATTDKGLLIPRLSIPDFSESAPVSSPKIGLLAVNTNATSGAGLVQWNGSKWQKISNAQDVTDYIAALGVARVCFVGTTTANGQTTGAVSGDVILNMNKLILNSGTLNDAANAYTIPSDGLYEITANWRATVNLKASYFIFKIFYTRSGTATLASESSFNQSGSFSNVGTDTSYIGELKAGDVISYTIFRSAGTSYTSYASISIKKID